MYRLKCPYCKGLIEVLKKELNCKIFRHGVYKSSMQQINPHEAKGVCDTIKKEDKIFGCGKPFQVDVLENGIAYIKKCGYL